MPNLCVAIMRQHERGVVFRLGRLRGVRGPGIRFMVESIVEIEDVSSAIGKIARATVRNVVGRSLPDQVLTDTETLNEQIKGILDGLTQQWGVLVRVVELKDIELPQSMQRAMARQAEAADVIADHPIALQLRNLQILAEIAAEKNSTGVFPAQFLESARALTRFVDQESRSTATAPAVTAPSGPGSGWLPRPGWPIPQDEALTDPLKGQVWT
ncbi:SPFH domain-containing protein [Kitasatospora camelliae]|uniref:SPFH domain-containing protein n=1 Tax=Kitasatospora camelliae TaxID=3156397 RepID=A0AAU8JR73_9ACTN